MSAPPLAAALARRLRGRVLVIGIGNPMRGDDVVGCQVARQLRQLAHEHPTPNLAVLVVEDVPESFAGPALAAHPDVVVLVDAVDLHAPPGSAALIDAESLGNGAAVTHRTPLRVLAQYLAHEARADVCLLGIQPANVAWGAALSPAVAAAARDTAAILLDAIRCAARAAGRGSEATAC